MKAIGHTILIRISLVVHAGEGVVLEPNAAKGWINVKWDKGGQGAYRWGVNGKYDLAVVNCPPVAALANAVLDKGAPKVRMPHTLDLQTLTDVVSCCHCSIYC